MSAGAATLATATATATAATPTVRAFFRRASFWIAAAVFVVLASVVLLVVRGGSGSANTDPLSITNAGPAGAKALAEVLRQQGVTVTAAASLDEARDSASSDSTVVVYDPFGYLPDDRQGELASAGARLVLIEPGLFELADLAPGVSVAGDYSASDTSTAGDAGSGCSLPAASRAGSISLAEAGTTYRVGMPADDAQTCFTATDDTYSLVQTSNGDQTVSVFGSGASFDNEHIVEAGNAALALGLLGESSKLVWYVPTEADVTASGPPSLGTLTPGWVTPTILLLGLVFIAGAVWRGRRLGPLVVENLPVIVRGSETVTGRARLYARSGARTRALDALRIGTIGRVSGLLGLARSASLDEVIVAVSVATGSHPQQVAATLVGTLPASEADLVELSTRLAALERAVRVSLGRDPAPRGPTAPTPATTPPNLPPDRTTPDKGTRS